MLVERGVHHTEFPEFDIFDPEYHGELLAWGIMALLRLLV